MRVVMGFVGQVMCISLRYPIMLCEFSFEGHWLLFMRAIVSHRALLLIKVRLFWDFNDPLSENKTVIKNNKTVLFYCKKPNSPGEQAEVNGSILSTLILTDKHRRTNTKIKQILTNNMNNVQTFLLGK